MPASWARRWMMARMDWVLRGPRGCPALSRRWNSGPSPIPRRGHPGADPPHCRLADVLGGPCAFLIRLRSANGEGVAAFGFEVGHIERGGFRHPEHGVTHDGEERGVPQTLDGPSTVGRHGGGGIGLFPADPGDLAPA